MKLHRKKNSILFQDLRDQTSYRPSLELFWKETLQHTIKINCILILSDLFTNTKRLLTLPKTRRGSVSYWQGTPLKNWNKLNIHHWLSPQVERNTFHFTSNSLFPRLKPYHQFQSVIQQHSMLKHVFRNIKVHILNKSCWNVKLF